jgi:hypothetical protein
MKFWRLLPALLLIAACRFDLTPAVSLGAVDTFDSSKPAFVEATLKFDWDNEEKKGVLLDFIGRTFVRTDYIAETPGDTKTLEVGIRLPLIDASAQRPESPGVFYFERDKADAGTQLWLCWDPAKFARANDELHDLIAASVAPGDIVYRFMVSNDENSSRRLSLSSEYLDGSPIPGTREVGLEPGQSVELRPSNVLQDSLPSDDRIPILTILKS